MAEAATLLTTPENTTEGQAAPAAVNAATDQKVEEGTAVETKTEPEAQPDTKQEAKVEEAPYELKAQNAELFDSPTLKAFTDAAKDLKVPVESAQKLLDASSAAIEQRMLQAAEARNAQWVEASKTDKEFGGDKLPEALAVAKKAMTLFGSPELSQLLEESGLGNHPAVIRALHKIGKSVSEDGRHVTGNGAAGVPSGPAQVNQETANFFYPNHKT